MIPAVTTETVEFYWHDGALFRRRQNGLYAAEVYWPKAGEWRWLDPGDATARRVSPAEALELLPGADLYAG